MTGDEIRTRFLEHFRSRDHLILESAPLVPVGDPSTLFISAGMQPLQPYFRGLSRPPAPRLASCQKCFRTGDLDEVGDDRHGTFFEMLGNFAPTGDYFKVEAIPVAWELVTDGFGMAKDRLRATVHPTDTEAREIWRARTDIRPEWVYDNEENWWGLASGLGPSGPDSEIWWDRGREFGCGQPDCYPDHCDRFVEFWNLVFPQFDRQADGTLVPLPRPGIDTGMGLERIAAILQGGQTVYETDLYAPVLEWIRESSGRPAVRPERIVADHLRGMCFVISAGVLPSKEGRGYVLRRLIRRALLHAGRLDLKRPLAEGVPAVVAASGRAYPELAAGETFIRDVIAAEATGYARALEQGVELFETAAERGSISGEDAFRLHDTYGFPIEMTQELAGERGLEVDRSAFDVLMAQQRQRSRGAVRDGWQEVQDLPASEFVGYEQLETETRLAALRVNDQPVAAAAEGDEVEVYLERTPFYAEAGGQVGDTGQIVGPAGSVRVDDTLKRTERVIVHLGTVVSGGLKVGETVRASVDARRRHQVARHHSATHLLHQALCEVLGVDNAQRGSWVGPDHTTFDFPLNRPLSDEELRRVSSRIREKVRQALPLHVQEMDRRQAEASGAKHLFEEKYGDRVRVVCFGDWTCELCGGTHVANSADVGTSLILSEASIGSGLRRIDLAAGEAADRVIERRLHALDEVAQALGARPEEAPLRVGELRAELKEAHREIEALKADLMRSRLPAADDGAPLIDHRVEEAWVDLKDFADEVLGRRQRPAVAFISRGQQYVLKVSAPLVDRYDATELRQLVGPGGGRPDLVSGKLDKTHEEAVALLRQRIR